MDNLNDMFVKVLAENMTEHPDKAAHIDIEGYTVEAIPKLAKLYKDSFMNSAPDTLIDKRKLSKKFEQRNIARWGKGFDLLETHIILCTEVGEGFNKSYRPEAVEKNDLVFDLVVRHHARACQIAGEILYLLKGGYADAAHA
ncbi:MAG: hypothetical protein D3903_04010 [Candidatus Electrothrix sp. GM3_4]|nr:hypothetical protein [Candidatus Electrothrix sp. GM3_4]